ncbi:MAG: hypothetical protein NTX75_08460 [Proteobacteria bacterium]|nr:hypothetical protein [Pseudomonadota bacterium]
MIYIIAILLLILVLANETARKLLGLLLIGAVMLAIAAAILFVIFMIVVWVLTSKRSADVSAPVTASVPTIAASPYSFNENTINIIAVVIIVGIIAAIIFDQYKLRKNKINFFIELKSERKNDETGVKYIQGMLL